MKNLFTKRLLAAVLALVVCVSVAGVSMAVESNATETRTVTVDTNDVITENFEGFGTNHWTYNYEFERNMNEAFQTVNDKRSNIMNYKYVRMLFMTDWLVDPTLSDEEQEEQWNNGIFHFDNIPVKNFFRNVEMYQKAGTTVLVNFGGRNTADTAEWWPVEDAAVTYGSSRGAPANLPAFAEATYAIFEYAWDHGYDNVTMLSFFNEVNGGNFEAFFDKKEYWVKMLKHVHDKFAETTYMGNPASIHYNKNARKEIEMFGTELSGFVDEAQIVEWLDYISEHLVDEDGNPAFDHLNSHHYPHYKTYDLTIDLFNRMGEKYPGIWCNEIGSRYYPSTRSSEPYCSSYKYGEPAMFAGLSNAGYTGALSWVATGMAPPPMNLMMRGPWDTPSTGLDQVYYEFAERGLATRYIPEDSKVYRSNFDSDDLLGAFYGLEDGNGNINDMVILVDAEENSSQREVTYKLGSKMANRTFKRMVYYYAPKDENGVEWDDGKYPNGDLLPVADKEITTDANGNFTDILPVDKHIEIIYTTVDELVQVVTDEDEVTLSAGGSKTFNVTEIYGTTDAQGNSVLDGTQANLNDVTWSIIGKSRSDTDGGYNLTTEGAGTITANGATATYNSTGTRNGDTVAIKVTSNYDPTSYTIIIVKIN